MPVLVAVWGASPGVGKSTVCAGLSGRLTAAGLRVDHFREEEIGTRPAFAAVAREFAATGLVDLDTLRAATTAFVDAVLAGGADVVIGDALVPFVPSLLAFGHDDAAISAFVADLTRILEPLQPILVFLDGNAEVALARATQREGPAWLDWYVGKLRRYAVQPAVTDVASAAAYLHRERAVTLSVAEEHGWPVLLVPQAAPDQVLAAVERGVAGWLPEPSVVAGHHVV